MTIDLESLTARLKIDENELDKELIEQPNLFFFVGRFYASATSQRDAQLQEIELMQSELDYSVRKKAQESGERITENQVKAAVIRSAEMQEALAKANELKRLAGVWTALRDAYQQRSYILLKLVDLYLAGYYGQVTGHGERNDALERTARSNRR